jgi:2-polyprenyl-3-methyl-5-hydroxy-6-metoxy-1,4-benzoquinol methylase
MPSGLQLAHCRACGLYARRDAPAPQTLELFYEREYNRRFAAEQSGTRDNLHAHALRRIESRVSFHDRGSGNRPDCKRHLIDVGCGNGRLLQLAQQAGWTVMGLDPSTDTDGQLQAAGIEIRRASWPLTDMSDHSADAIVFLNVLDHLPDPFTALQTAWRVLRPAGVLYVRVPNGPFHLRLLTGRWSRTLSTLPVFHLYGFGRRSLQHFLTRAGFEQIDIRTAPLSEGDAYANGKQRGTVRTLAKHVLKVGYGLSACVGLDRLPWGPSIEALASKPNQAPHTLGHIGLHFDAQEGAG